MWLFYLPKNYSEMLLKIATTMFFISLIMLAILSNIVEEIESLMKIISFGINYKFGGFELYLSYFYFPIIFALAESMFKLHDRISDLFSIRYNFEKNVIIAEFLIEIRLYKKFKKVNKSNRKIIMDAIFYKYASSTNPQIERHLIDMALSSWCWYWIVMDTALCVVVSGVVCLIYTFSVTILFALFVFVLICLLIMYIIKTFQCRNYAIREVKAILELENSRNEIERFLNYAL